MWTRSHFLRMWHSLPDHHEVVDKMWTQCACVSAPTWSVSITTMVLPPRQDCASRRRLLPPPLLLLLLMPLLLPPLLLLLLLMPVALMGPEALAAHVAETIARSAVGRAK